MKFNPMHCQKIVKLLLKCKQIRPGKCIIMSNLWHQICSMHRWMNHTNMFKYRQSVITIERGNQIWAISRTSKATRIYRDMELCKANSRQSWHLSCIRNIIIRGTVIFNNKTIKPFRSTIGKSHNIGNWGT